MSCFSPILKIVRADRLVAIVLLLQAHRQLTAPELAERLEVSERTVRRDLDALLMAGVPLYSQRGRGGGWALLDGHKMNLSGMTPAEAQALFLVAGPGALGGLGVEDGVRSALRKLMSQLPEAAKEHAMKASAAVHVDPATWGREAEEAPHLTQLREAVVQGVQIEIGYAKPGQPPATRLIHPYGLVAKAGVWYLVAGSEAGIRTFRVSRVTDVAATQEPVVKPDDFDLAQAWDDVRLRMSGRRGSLDVQFVIQPGHERFVTSLLGWWVDLRQEGAGSQRRYTGTFAGAEMAARELARFAGQVTVLGPPEVRAALAAMGRELLEVHGAS
jgi:predicted DNA-binding transcriptional regulator YafY